MTGHTDRLVDGGVRLRSFDADEAGPLLDRLVGVYLEVYADPDDLFHSEDRYRLQLAGHRSVPGWTLVTCEKGGGLVGYAYGFPLAPGTRWWHGLLTPVPDGFVDEDGRRTFAISEIMVRAPWRRQGIARTLHDRLLAGRRERRATLLADPENAPAQAAYGSWGWTKVAELRPAWDNAPRFDVLTRPLPAG